MKIKSLCYSLLLAIALTLTSTGTSRGLDLPPIEDLMSPELFTQTGLHKLSATELAMLNMPKRS